MQEYERWRNKASFAAALPTKASIAALFLAARKDELPETLGQGFAEVHAIPSLEGAELKDALAKIKSDLLYVMVAGDRSAAGAQLRLAALFDQQPSLALAYSDHELRDGAGKRRPILKPGWDPELQASGDYLGPGLMLRRRSLPGGVASLRQLLFDWAPTLPDEGVRHLALPLIESGGRWPSILEQRRPAAGRQELASWPQVSVIVPTRDHAQLLKVCLDGVMHQTDYPDIEVIVVDNASRETDALAYLAAIEADPRVRVLRDPDAFNYSRLNNRAAAIARGEVLVLLNNDTQVIEPGWLKALVGQVIRPEIGVAGALLLYPDGNIQHAGISLGIRANAWHVLARQAPEQHDLACYPRQVLAVTGACLAIRRQVYLDLGGMDEDFPITFNDVDLCLKARKQGLRVLCTPAARLIHHESKTRGLDISFNQHIEIARARRRLLRLHGKVRESDPFFNPNLTPGLSEPRLLRRGF